MFYFVMEDLLILSYVMVFFFNVVNVTIRCFFFLSDHFIILEFHFVFLAEWLKEWHCWPLGQLTTMSQTEISQPTTNLLDELS